MLEITNWRVYDLEESVIACRNAMRLEMPDYNQEEFDGSLPRAIKLVMASKDGMVRCHQNFLKGIRVSFDLKYTQYITKQLQRYGHFDYVSSNSLMHRITKMDFSKCVTKYVTQRTIDEVNRWKDLYNELLDKKTESYEFDNGRGETFRTENHAETMYVAFMMLISNCPMGTELFVRVSTNYLQLQTMYFQRKNHKLKEDYGAFCKFVESLPYAKELIIGEGNEKVE